MASFATPFIGLTLVITPRTFANPNEPSFTPQLTAVTHGLHKPTIVLPSKPHFEITDAELLREDQLKEVTANSHLKQDVNSAQGMSGPQPAVALDLQGQYELQINRDESTNGGRTGMFTRSRIRPPKDESFMSKSLIFQ